jgi:protein-S-isoprenylcysteine O-methyltransferase Ste14
LAAATGVMAPLVPWLLTGWRSSHPSLPIIVSGVVVTALGTIVLLEAFARFVLEGRGTLAPVAPTDRLVVGGLYRHIRNAMYVAVIGDDPGTGAAAWTPGARRIRRCVYGDRRYVCADV